MTTFKEVDALERQVLLALIEEEQFEVSDLIRKATPLDERIKQQRAYYARYRAAQNRAAPQKVTPKKAPFEVKNLPKNLPKGHPDYERQQEYYDRLWREQRRQNGYHDL